MNVSAKPCLLGFLVASAGLGFSQIAENRAPDHALLEKAVGDLGKTLGVKFDIPFPKEWDIDVWLKHPLARIPVEGGKVTVTRPFVNPWDGQSTLHWMVAPGSYRRLSDATLSCHMNLDKDGEFQSISLLASPDSWAVRRGTPQLERQDDESGEEFFRRAMQEYRKRAASAADPDQAAHLLKGFEKVAAALQSLRKKHSVG